MTSEGIRFAWRSGERTSHVRLSVYYRAPSSRLHESLELAKLDARTGPELCFMERADGLVWLIDSSPNARGRNLGHFERRFRQLVALGRDPARVPTVFQVNKRDLSDAESLQELRASLMFTDEQCVESVASAGVGVREALERLLLMIAGEVPCHGMNPLVLEQL